MSNGCISRYLLCLFAVLTVVLFSVSDKAYADQGAVISAPDDVKSGASFDVTLTFSADENIGWFETNIVYDSKLLEYQSGSANGGEGNLHLRSFTESDTKTVTEKLTFKALDTGSPEISLLNCSVFSPDGVPLFTPSASVKVNVRESTDSPADTDSSDAQNDTDSSSLSDGDGMKCTLKSLGVSSGELSPDFSPDIFDYTVKLDNDVKKVEILTELASKGDYIWFECSSWFSKTEDPKQIIVNIYDGDVKLKITVKDNETEPTVTNVYRILFQTGIGEDSSQEESSSVTDSDPQASVTTTVTTAAPQTSSTVSSRTTAAPKEKSGMSELRDKLMPWLLVILLVLIIALILVIYWIRSRTDRKRRKIKTTSRK